MEIEDLVTQSGCTDIIVTKNKFGDLLSTPFYICFGFYNLLSINSSRIRVKINGVETNILMKLGTKGYIFPVDDTDKSEKSEDYGDFIPSNCFLSKLDLHKGKNQIEFTLEYLFVWEKTLTTDIYYFDETTKFFISDVDGTITKSDILGVFMPTILGKDWTQIGVAKLYHEINLRDYQVIYLSAKPFIAHLNVKWYLTNINQGIIITTY